MAWQEYAPQQLHITSDTGFELVQMNGAKFQQPMQTDGKIEA